MKPTENALLQALRQYGKAQAKRPPGEGWQTIQELANAEGITPAAIKYRMKLAQDQGVVFDNAVGSVPDDAGRLKRAVFFRLRNGGKP